MADDLEALIAEAASFAPYADDLPLSDLVGRLLEALRKLKADRDEALGDRDDFRERLHDVVMIDSEAWAIGGGLGFKERHSKAWSRAREPFEP